MMLRPFVLAGLAVLSLLATATIVALNIGNALTVRSSPTIQIAAIIGSACEAVIFLLLLILLYTVLRPASPDGSVTSRSLWSALSLLGSVLAKIPSVVVLILMKKGTQDGRVLGAPELSYFVATAVVLGLAFAGQLAFVVALFVAGRLSGGPDTDQRTLSPHVRVKAIPYTRTTVTADTNEKHHPEYQSPPGSSCGRSRAGTMSSIRSSFSHAVRPITSKTRLLSVSSKTGRRRSSYESTIHDRQSSADGFDSWDTSAVDDQCRETVIETYSPAPPRYLETIPASPLTSRTPSLEPPPRAAKRRSRSYSPAVRRPLPTLQHSASEAHIHPLFRSDSPAPPPVTAETSVYASPEAGRFISQRNLTRMRSGSSPATPSLLSREGSLDSRHRKAESTDSNSSDQMSLSQADSLEEERMMTPPIPEWVLTAGARTSLTEYHARRAREAGDDEEDKNGLGIMQ